MRYVSGSAELVRDFGRNRDSFDTYAVGSRLALEELVAKDHGEEEAFRIKKVQIEPHADGRRLAGPHGFEP